MESLGYVQCQCGYKDEIVNPEFIERLLDDPNFLKQKKYKIHCPRCDSRYDITEDSVFLGKTYYTTKW
jgi:DNA-directed RNA polymerase subunit RPC12/RpoP